MSSSSGVGREIQQFLQLAIPLSSAQLAQSLTSFFDTLMMGRLGTQTLAAGGLATLSFSALILTAGGLIMAITPAIAQAFGANAQNRIENLARQGLWLVVFSTIPLIGIISNLDFLMAVFGQTKTIIILGNIYLEIMLWGIFPALGFIWLRGVVSGLSQARPIMFIVVTGTLFNILGNYTLAFGKWGFPRLELAGLALSTVITHWGMFLALIIYIISHQHLRKYHIFSQLYSFKPYLFWELIKIGFPIAVFSALEIGLFTVVTYLMGALGTNVLAAHQIVLQTIAVIFMIPLGMSFAATIRVGQLLGKENFQGVQRAGYLSIGMGFIFMSLMAMILLLFPEFVIGLYLDLNDPANQPVIVLVTPMLTIAALSQICDGVQKIAYGVLQGLQDTRTPMLFSIPAFWMIGLPFGYCLGFHAGWGGAGLWFGQSIGVAIAGFVFMGRFYYLTNLSSM
ncbi:MAG: MATE family efflux transporter [Crocosphaera sp.]